MRSRRLGMSMTRQHALDALHELGSRKRLRQIGMSASVEVDTGHARGLPKIVTHALAAIGLGGRTAVAAPAQ